MSNVVNTHTRLKTARRAAGYKTATEFCEKNQIPISTYNMHETGKRKIMPDIAEKYSNILKLNTSWLLTGTGTPYPEHFDSEDTSNLTEDEYLELLNYKGNKKLSQPHINKNLPSLQIDPTLFCKIVIEIVEVLKEYNLNLDLNFISSHTIEIYRDIVQASDSSKDQITMVNLAITIFKRQIHKHAQEDKIKSANK
jgi:hypothetical protein